MMNLWRAATHCRTPWASLTAGVRIRSLSLPSVPHCWSYTTPGTGTLGQAPQLENSKEETDHSFSNTMNTFLSSRFIWTKTAKMNGKHDFVSFSVKRSDDVNESSDGNNVLNYFIRDFSNFQNEQNIVLITDKKSIFGISEIKYLSRFSLKISIIQFSTSDISQYLEVHKKSQPRKY